MPGDKQKRLTSDAERAEWDRVRSWSEDGRSMRTGDGPADELENELRKSGIPLRFLWELANLKASYPGTIPILLAHLDRPYPDYIKCDIFRILGRKNSGRVVHEALLSTLRRDYAELSQQTAFALGAAIAETAPKGTVETLLEVATNREYGAARDMPIQKLATLGDPRAQAAIAKYFADDPSPAAIRALRVAKMWDHADAVATHVSSQNEYVRDEARKFLRSRAKAAVS